MVLIWTSVVSPRYLTGSHTRVPPDGSFTHSVLADPLLRFVPKVPSTSGHESDKGPPRDSTVRNRYLKPTYL